MPLPHAIDDDSHGDGTASNVVGQLERNARRTRFSIAARLIDWRSMAISDILQDAVLGDIRAQTVITRRMGSDVCAQGIVKENAPTSAIRGSLGGRLPPASVTDLRTLVRTVKNDGCSSVFGSILASLNSPRKRKRREEDDHLSCLEDKNKQRKSLSSVAQPVPEHARGAKFSEEELDPWAC